MIIRELFASTCLAERFLSISSHHLCPFQCEGGELQNFLNCFEEVACTYQVTGDILKATFMKDHFDLKIWP